jgi:hypothetical protein
MGYFSSHKGTVFLLAGTVSSFLYSASLSDLEAFTRSALTQKKVLTDRNVQERYRKVLSSYSPPQGPTKRDFEKVWTEIAKVRSGVSGVGARLLAERKPMAIQYSAPGKPTFRFERVRQGLHSVWLLESLREPEDACSPRDVLLVDRWTPLLQDAAFFTVERNGTFTGTSLLLVPVKNRGVSYMLVSPSDPKAQLPPDLLSAFLRDYRKREPRTLPFALLTQDASGAFRMTRVDPKGHSTEPLGPVEGFKLADPSARRIADAVPTRCYGKNPSSLGDGVPRSVASVGSPGIGVSVGININSNTGSTPSTSNSAAIVPNQGYSKVEDTLSTNENIQSSKQFPPEILKAKDTDTLVQKDALVSSPAVVPPSTSGKVSQDLEPQLVNMENAEQSGTRVPQISNPSPTASNYQPASSGNSSRPVGETRAGNNSVLASFSPSVAMPSTNSTPLTQNDKHLLKAIDDVKRALDEKKPLNPNLLSEIGRGASITQNPEIAKKARSAFSEAYYKGNPVDTFKKLQEIQRKRPEEAKLLLEEIRRNLCNYCDDCEACE